MLSGGDKDVGLTQRSEVVCAALEKAPASNASAPPLSRTAEGLRNVREALPENAEAEVTSRPQSVQSPEEGLGVLVELPTRGPQNVEWPRFL